MRYIVAFFVFISFLFFKGHHYIPYGQASASTSKALGYTSLNKTYHEVTYKAAPVNLENERLNATELDDDDDYNPSSEYGVISSNCLAFFYANAPPCLTIFIKKHLPFCWYLSYTATLKYILYQVIRI